MSRIHDALRKAGQEAPVNRGNAPRRVVPPDSASAAGPELPPSIEPYPAAPMSLSASKSTVMMEEEPEARELEELERVIRNAREGAFSPQNDALLVNPLQPREAPAEEFRTLRTRLNHLQSLQPLHTLVVTSASPAEGKSFTAANLAVTQAQLADKRILLADFDFRRPNIDKTFQIDCAPGIPDYLRGNANC